MASRSFTELRLQNGRAIRASTLLVPDDIKVGDVFGYGERFIGIVAVRDDPRELTTVSVKRPARQSMYKHAMRVLNGMLKEAVCKQ
jgi:hypothetical protein